MPRTTGTTLSKCKVAGCGSDATRIKHQMCEKHYMRQRRNGSTAKKGHAKAGKLTHSGGNYYLIYAPNHELRRASPRIYEHRFIYYEAHGEGPFRCYHCGADQTWDTMHIDHLDDNPRNNSIDNLACSCPKCNLIRGAHKMKKKAQERSGWMVEFNGERMHVSDWAKRLGISRNAMKTRLAKWPVERALTEPRGPTGPK